MAKITLNGTVNLDTRNLPKELPMPQFSVNIKVHRMSTGASGSGFEVIERLGTYYKDFKFDAVFLTTAQMSALENLAVNQTVFILLVKTDEDVTVGSYNVTFAEDGYEPFIRALAEYEDDNPSVYGAKLTFKIINKNT